MEILLAGVPTTYSSQNNGLSPLSDQMKMYDHFKFSTVDH